MFELITEFSPTGDQPEAIRQLVENIEAGVQNQVLLGVTGSGKTFAVAHTIASLGRPALILAPNKTLAAQLYNEFRSFFPHNAVEYFVSFYDYYQPEAYVPSSDTYIEKDSSINDDIDKLRHAATHALLTRRDVVIIASVSCIYGLGSPEYYAKLIIPVEKGQRTSMNKIMEKLVLAQYERNDYDFHRATFRVRGDVLEVIPAYEHERALRIAFWDDEIENISEIDPLTGDTLAKIGKTVIYPASHFVSDGENIKRAIVDIRDELQERLSFFKSNNQLLEEQRLRERTLLDLEMLEELGYCNGVENYSRHLDGRQEGEPPSCLLDYFPPDFLMFIDESHVAVPQLGAMYKGDRSRKETLVNYGFRLPSALDNRPLEFREFLERTHQTIFVSATPGPFEKDRSHGLVVEQVIRPTGLIDPVVEIRPVTGQMDDLLSECRSRAAAGEAVLVTTLTKRMAEDLTEYFNTMHVRSRYLHSDIDTMERMAIILALRRGEFDVIVGINLLREGLDIPEVSLVAILDADKEGFLRSTGSLVQTFGRAARNEKGRVIMYADKITDSMQRAMDETTRRRALQTEYNQKHDITPKSIKKSLDTPFESIYVQSAEKAAGKQKIKDAMQDAGVYNLNPSEITALLKKLEKEMRDLARDLEFEKAAATRDRIRALREQYLVE